MVEKRYNNFGYSKFTNLYLRTTSGFDPSQLEAALAERNSLRDAISKIAMLRKQEIENQRVQKEEINRYKEKAENSDRLLEENNVANEKLKTVSSLNHKCSWFVSITTIGCKIDCFDNCFSDSTAKLSSIFLLLTPLRQALETYDCVNLLRKRNISINHY